MIKNENRNTHMEEMYITAWLGLDKTGGAVYETAITEIEKELKVLGYDEVDIDILNVRACEIVLRKEYRELEKHGKCFEEVFETEI